MHAVASDAQEPILRAAKSCGTTARPRLRIPTITADLFSRAAANLAKHATSSGASVEDVDAILLRGAEQAARLLAAEGT